MSYIRLVHDDPDDNTFDWSSCFDLLPIPQIIVADDGSIFTVDFSGLVWRAELSPGPKRLKLIGHLDGEEGRIVYASTSPSLQCFFPDVTLSLDSSGTYFCDMDVQKRLLSGRNICLGFPGRRPPLRNSSVLSTGPNRLVSWVIEAVS